MRTVLPARSFASTFGIPPRARHSTDFDGSFAKDWAWALDGKHVTPSATKHRITIVFIILIQQFLLPSPASSFQSARRSGSPVHLVRVPFGKNSIFPVAGSKELS